MTTAARFTSDATPGLPHWGPTAKAGGEITLGVALPEEVDELFIAGVAGLRNPVRLKIADLVYAETPRLRGEDPAHTMQLVEAGGPLPPIIVHRETRHIVDGVHRVRAALMDGLDEIEAIMFDGPPEAAFIIAVAANARHGLPLSLPDRRVAATRIIRTYPQWSDRAIARTTGLSAKTVGAIRRASAESPQLHTRLGRDGRVHPLNAATGRRAAAEYLSAHPQSSLRTVAKFAGISPTTVRDVRDRLARGEDPAPDSAGIGRDFDRGIESPTTSHVQPEPPRAFVEVQPLLATLAKDPAVRMTGSGRELLRWLHGRVVDDVDTAAIVASVPKHCIPHIAELASRCASNWASVAEQLTKGG